MSLVREPDYTVELSGEEYSFDYLGIWVESEGIYLSTDSGCSCPMPWESHTLDDLTGPLTREQAYEESTSLSQTSWFEGYGQDEIDRIFKEEL